MLLWRISNHAELSGKGAEGFSGRRHTAVTGKRVVYLAEHPAVALVETLANLRGDPTLFPRHFQLLKIVVPDQLVSDELTEEQRVHLSSDELATTQILGDAWLSSGTSALLRVPSVPSPESWNYLLNPLHPDAAGLHIEWARQIAYDKRLFHLHPNA